MNQLICSTICENLLIAVFPSNIEMLLIPYRLFATHNEATQKLLKRTINAQRSDKPFELCCRVGTFVSAERSEAPV
jgi:hypothetical protein